MTTPLVSIIIPTFNRANLIGDTLDSVLMQSYTNWECIIVDDGSTDTTFQLITEYVNKDSRFQYYERPEDRIKGANACRNYGFELSNGDYIQFLDSDDIISIDKISNQLQLLELKGDTLTLATCSFSFFDKTISNSIIHNQEPFCKDFNTGLDLLNAFGVNGGYFPQHVYLFHRKLFALAGGWNEVLRINQDGEFFCRIILECNKVVFITNSVAYQRNNTGFNTSSTVTSENMEDRIKSWKLIENSIANKLNISNSDYVRKAKEKLFKHCFKKYKGVILVRFFFFKEQFLKWLVQKMNKMLKVNF